MKSEIRTIAFLLAVVVATSIVSTAILAMFKSNDAENKDVMRGLDVRYEGIKTQYPEYETLFDYNFTENDAVLLYINYSNTEGNILGQLTMYSYKLKISNRTIEGMTLYGIDIVNMTLWIGAKNESHSYLFKNVVGEGNYMLDVSLVTRYGTIRFEPIYIYE